MYFNTKQYQGETKTLWNGYVVETGDFASAGIMFTGFDLMPGNAWEVECKALAPTKFTRHAFMSWPSEGSWPAKGEIDYWEAGGDSEYSDRQSYKISSWYKDPLKEGDGRAHFEKKIDSNSLETHVYRVEWYEDRLVFFVDGNEVWYVEDNVPQGPHRLAFQTALEGGPKAKEGTEPATVELSAVRIYQMNESIYAR